MVLVDPQGPGRQLLPSPSSSGAAPAHRGPRRRRGPSRSAPAPRAVLIRHAVAGLTLTAAGLVAGARDLTADYIKGRTQFGRSLAEFQAVAMQIADVYIASRTLDLAAANAAWRVREGLDVSDDLAVAAYWICREAPKALRTCHHLHGGMGRRRHLPAAPLLLLGHRHRPRPGRVAG